MPADAAPPLVLYDGACWFCSRVIGLLVKHDRKRRLRFAPRDSSLGHEIALRHPELAGVDSIVWFEPATGVRPERVAVRSTAALEIAHRLGGPWQLARIGWLVPRPLRDAIYDLIARRRHRLGAGDRTCPVPPPNEPGRFLE
jgi:predicted DCC family thiol-disulfide oxidoreductase YuxK